MKEQLQRQKEEQLQMSKHPINNSKTKQLISFPKADRFHNKHNSYCAKQYYDIPGTLTSRPVGMGYGTKTDFSKLYTQTPGPANYQYDTKLFKGQQSTSKSGTFGAGRVQGKVQTAPGPQSYVLQSTLNKKGATLKPRNEPKIGTVAPGPGAYNHNDLMSPSKQSKTIVSQGASRQPKLREQMPGPQQYEPKTSFSPNGTYGISKFQSSQGCGFGFGEKLPQPKPRSPGPGVYRIPGEFGYY